MATERIGTIPNHSHAKATWARQRLIEQLRRSEVTAAVRVTVQAGRISIRVKMTSSESRP